MSFLFSYWRSALLILAIVAIGGYFYLSRGNSLGPTLAIAPGDFAEQVSVSGTVTAAHDVALGFAANGRIAGVYARVGQHVSLGSVLAETENGDLVATVALKSAALASLLAGTRPEQIAVTEASVASAATSLANAVQNAYTTADDAVHNRADSFFTNPRTTPKLSFTVPNAVLVNTVERDRATAETSLSSLRALAATLTADNAADIARQAQPYLAQLATFLANANQALNQAIADQTTSAATLSSYSTTLATARANVNTVTTGLSAALSALTDAQKTLALQKAGPTEANVAAAKADVENARANLAKTRIVAPFSGVITRMDAKVGEIASPTTSGIAMQSDGLFQIETYIPEVAIARVARGDSATTTLDAYGPTIAFPSTVIEVDPAETVKDGVPTYKTVLVFGSVDPRIRSGMTANVSIKTGVLRDAIVIPAGAISFKAGSSSVSVVHDKTVEKRPVTVGPSPSLGQISIVSGLSAGDVILLTPAP